ncbi:MAG: lipopolysaccharide heptosyltransferase II [Planctomycetota bacterium]|nr:MAG: lipopolysaccharide heptosyltransferase II [Planctomycetota bacterium]
MSLADLAQRDFQRILILKPSSPGDIIHALPVLHGLRRRLPDAHIAWLVATPFANLIEADPALSEVIPFDRKRYGRLGRSVSITGEFLGFVKSLRARHFDLVIDLQGLFRSGFLALASGAPVRIGFAAAREMAWMFYTHKIPLGPTREEHAAVKNYRAAALLGFEDRPMDFSIALKPEDRAVARAVLAEAGIGEDESYAVLVPATRWETKCWPPDRYGRVAAALREQIGLRSILVGGASDITFGAIAAGASNDAAHNLCGRTTLRELAALIECAAVVVTADSTPMHMAAAMNRPLVALFGPTNPTRTGPYNRMNDVLRIDLDCSPCYFKKLSQCPHQHACMQRLGVETVTHAAMGRLATSSAVSERID